MNPKRPEPQWQQIPRVPFPWLELKLDGRITIQRANDVPMPGDYHKGLNGGPVGPDTENWQCKKVANGPLEIYDRCDESTPRYKFEYQAHGSTWSIWQKTASKDLSPNGKPNKEQKDDSIAPIRAMLQPLAKGVLRLIGDPDRHAKLSHYCRADIVEVPEMGCLNFGDALSPVALHCDGAVALPNGRFGPRSAIDYNDKHVQVRRRRGRYQFLFIRFGTQEHVLTYEQGTWYRWCPTNLTGFARRRLAKEHLSRRGLQVVDPCWRFLWILFFTICVFVTLQSCNG